jgi:phage-related protein
MQVSASYKGSVYRVVYASKLPSGLYVLHAFRKKAKQGMATPRTEVDLIQRRYRMAREHHRREVE